MSRNQLAPTDHAMSWVAWAAPTAALFTAAAEAVTGAVSHAVASALPTLALAVPSVTQNVPALSRGAAKTAAICGAVAVAAAVYIRHQNAAAAERHEAAVGACAAKCARLEDALRLECGASVRRVQRRDLEALELAARARVAEAAHEAATDILLRRAAARQRILEAHWAPIPTLTQTVGTASRLMGAFRR